MDVINDKLYKYIKKLYYSTDPNKSEYYRKKIKYYKHMNGFRTTHVDDDSNMQLGCGKVTDTEITAKREQVLKRIKKLEEPYKKCSNEYKKFKQAVNGQLSQKDAEILELKSKMVETSSLLSSSEEDLGKQRASEKDFLDNVLEITITTKPLIN